MVNLAAGLVRLGVTVDLVLATAEGPYLEDVPARVHIVDLKAKRVLTSLPSLIRYMRQAKPNVMLSTLSHANIVALWARRISAVPMRLIVRQANTLPNKKQCDVTMHDYFERRLIHWFYPWADGIVAPSKGVREDLQVNGGLSKLPIKVIYNPVIGPMLFEMAKQPLSHPWTTDTTTPLILAVGRLTQQKDFSTLIQAFSMLRKTREANLIILGEGELRNTLETEIKEAGLQDVVQLPGFDANPFKYMAHAAVFVLSSAWEGLPNVLLQAIALGIPVVATDCQSGPKEILDNGRYGELVPIGDAFAMAAAILRSLAAEPDPQDTEGVLKAYGMEGIAKQYLDYFVAGIHE